MMVRELWDKKNMPRNKSGYKAIKTARQNSLHAEAGPAAVLAVRRGSGTMFHERIIGKYNLIRAAQRLPFLLFLRLLGAGPASVVHHWRWTELTDRCMNHYLNLFGRERKQQATEAGIAETAAAPRIGARAVRPDLERPDLVDPGDRAAAGPDLDDVDHRQDHRVAVGIAAHVVTVGVGRLAVA